MPFDFGDIVPLTVEIRDSDGNLANAGAVTVTVTKPDGTPDSPAVVNISTGRYGVDYVPAAAGRYLIRWVATGQNASAFTDAFDVRESSPPLLFSLTDAKSILNITVSTHDDKIRELTESTTAAVENLVGPVVMQTKVELYSATGSNVLVLRSAPVISLTNIVSIQPGVSLPDVLDLDLDPETGIVIETAGRGFYGPLRVSYVAGRTVIPAAIRDAGRFILKHLWDVHNGLIGLPRLNEANDPGTGIPLGLGYAIPNRAIQLLQPYMRVGDFA